MWSAPQPSAGTARAGPLRAIRMSGSRAEQVPTAGMSCEAVCGQLCGRPQTRLGPGLSCQAAGPSRSRRLGWAARAPALSVHLSVCLRSLALPTRWPGYDGGGEAGRCLLWQPRVPTVRVLRGPFLAQPKMSPAHAACCVFPLRMVTKVPGSWEDMLSTSGVVSEL